MDSPLLDQHVAINSSSSPSIQDATPLPPSDDAHYKKAARLSVFVVSSSLFLDALLYSLPISFYPVLLKNTGKSDFDIGFLFGCKAIAQILCNPIFGFVTNRFGVPIPMLFSTAIVVVSTVLFGLIDPVHYDALCAVRALQGVGSAGAFASGMTHLALVFQTDKQRGEAMGNALGGIGLAILVGPLLGSLIDHFTDRAVPFYGVAGLAAVQFCMLLYSFYFDPNLKAHRDRFISTLPHPPSYIQQLKPLVDPYIFILLATYAVMNAVICSAEFLLPIYLTDEFDASTLMLGLVFLPMTFAYMILTPLVGRFAGRFGRTTVIIAGLGILALTQMVFTLPGNLIGILFMMTPVGIGFAAVDGCVSTVLSNLLDMRHGRETSGGYGILFSAVDMSLSIGYILGAYGSSAVVNKLGFAQGSRIWGGLILLCIPFIYLLRAYDVEIGKQYDPVGPNESETEETNRGDGFRGVVHSQSGIGEKPASGEDNLPHYAYTEYTC